MDGTRDEPTYDAIGRSYGNHRRTEPRLAADIIAALGDARTVVNVGAGTGSYEPVDRSIVAVEPSATMIAQRPPGAAPVVQAVAEALPLRDRAFDAAMAVLTVHHWRNFARGMDELRRVARRRVVIVTWDPEVFAARFWLARDYLPATLAAERDLHTLRDVVAALGTCDVRPLPVPHDCVDGFYGAYWRRPSAYLDAGVRAGISALARLDTHTLRPALERLAADVASGAWHARYAALLDEQALDLGYRIVVAPPG
jgi:SAM-dependent methyltransferase